MGVFIVISKAEFSREESAVRGRLRRSCLQRQIPAIPTLLAAMSKCES